MTAGEKSIISRMIDSMFTDAELARLRSLPTRRNEYGYDPFGFNREDVRIALLGARFLYRRYFRGRSFGVENIPRGRVMLVANHSGQLPFDAVNIGAVLFFEADPPRMLRAMIERFVPKLPYVSYLFARWGQVLGNVENCRRLLGDEEAILVFPEGARGISKSFTNRYQLQPFGGGFIRLALQTGTPIVPVAVVGAEEQAPAINIKPLAKMLGLPAFPVMLFPPFVPIPLPARYRIYFGEPCVLKGDPDDDDERVGELARQVRLKIESMLRVGLKERRGVYF